MDYLKDIKFRVGIAIFVLIFFGAAFYAGFSHGKNQIPSILEVEGLENKTLGAPEGVDFSLFWDAWRAIEEEYVGRNDLDRQEMVFGAISGLIKSLEDPYTVFFKPQDSKIFQEDVSGSFEGIGAEIGIRDGVLTIISPLKNSPAEQAGIKPGDKILEIDGVSTDSIIDVTEAVKKIRGPKGTQVTMTILREGAQATQDIAIIRNTIVVPVVEWEEKEEGVIHLRLFSFSQNAPAEFRKAVLAILKKNPSKIILDLRNNPGGFLESAQEITGWFVDPGEVVAIEDFGDGRGKREYRAIGNGALRTFDLVVLINKGSASASEITAGALRDIRGVKLVGEKSFGKGSIQQLFELAQGSLKVTIAKWLTPSGKSISEEGLEPDIVVEISTEDIGAGRDPQLERALELLR